MDELMTVFTEPNYVSFVEGVVAVGKGFVEFCLLATDEVTKPHSLAAAVVALEGMGLFAFSTSTYH